MKKTIGMLLLSAFCFGSCKQIKNDTPGTSLRPNVLFILADDLGYHDLGATGSSYYETPNIDRIANEGVSFKQGYATCQVCSPSRASIMTGQFPARHGITDWIGAKSGVAWRERKRYSKLLPADYQHSLSLEHVTLAEAMKKEGYKTFFAGKWHLGGEGSHPEDHGFDINVGGWDVGSPKGGYFAPYNNPKLVQGEPGENLTLRLARETLDFMKNHRDSSFFAFLSFYAVHSPLQTNQARWEKYRAKAVEMGVPAKGYEMERELPIRRTQDNPLYAGLVESMDDAVGIVLNGLQELGLSENTIVIFTSDNGGVASGDGYATSNLPLRGGKGYQWEGGIREPYFIKAPWLKSSVKEVNTPATGADFYPTILDLAGIALNPSQHADGISLVPLLQGKEVAERPLFWHYPHYGNQGGEPSSIIRLGDWKLIHYWEDGRQELYNLTSDPGEQTDISSQHPERLQQMGDQLQAWLNDMDAKKPVPDPEHDEELYLKRRADLENKAWPSLEERRMKQLQPGWQPNEDWWGSQVNE